MPENIHEPGDNPDNSSGGAKPLHFADTSPSERRETKSSLGRAAFLIFCIAAMALVIRLYTN